MRNALLSVYDKAGLVGFAAGLVDCGFQLIASGGTARALGEAGLEVRSVESLTRAPEMLSGRVKTLHPNIHGGILARRGREDDMATLRVRGIEPIDLCCVNLYPFERALDDGEADPEALRELIDIGGPTLLRAAAKSWPDVIPVPAPVFYDEVLAALRENGTCSVSLRRRLAAAVFRRTSGYDRAIATQLEREAGSLSAEEDGTGSARVIELERVHALRYGENPHQRATLYRPVGEVPRDLGAHTLIRGKALSYNNLLDLDTAIRLVRDLPGEVAACVVKHGTPCGAASGNDGATVFRAAHAGDPLSAFGGIVAVRPRLTGAVAEALLEEARFIECVAAPGFDDDAVALLSRRKTMRLVVCDPEPATGGSEVRSIAGGVLVQDTDSSTLHTEPFELQTDHPLSEAASRDLRFALACVKHARSNAITVASNGALLGCGSGHTSRVGAVRLALSHAGDKARGAVLASDAFFPFADSIDLCHEAGIAAIVEPGGSKRDAEVIAACERLGIALVFTGVRHFRH